MIRIVVIVAVAAVFKRSGTARYMQRGYMVSPEWRNKNYRSSKCNPYAELKEQIQTIYSERNS